MRAFPCSEPELLEVLPLVMSSALSRTGAELLLYYHVSLHLQGGADISSSVLTPCRKKGFIVAKMQCPRGQ